MAIPPWKLNLKPATYNGIEFKVEVDARSSGRRKALHEFPKRNKPYLEDMGRRARRFTIQAYVIGPFYEDQRDALIEQLEADSDGQLVHPTYIDVDAVGVDGYSVIERRERGGYAEFEITFIEAGADVSTQYSTDTQGAVTGAADAAAGVQGSGLPTVADVANTFMGSSDITGLNLGPGFP